MFDITISLPEAIDFTRAGQVFRAELAKMPVTIVQQLVMHGAIQKIGDAASGAKGDGVFAINAMTAAHEALLAGNWGRTRGAAGEPLVNRFIRDIIRAVLSDASKKEYKALDAEKRNEWLDAKFDALTTEQADAVTRAAEAAMETWQAEQAAKKAMVGELGIKL